MGNSVLPRPEELTFSVVHEWGCSPKGGVKVIDAVGEVLTLSADNGQYFYFDVASRQYLKP